MTRLDRDPTREHLAAFPLYPTHRYRADIRFRRIVSLSSKRHVRLLLVSWRCCDGSFSGQKQRRPLPIGNPFWRLYGSTGDVRGWANSDLSWGGWRSARAYEWTVVHACVNCMNVKIIQEWMSFKKRYAFCEAIGCIPIEIYGLDAKVAQSVDGVTMLAYFWSYGLWSFSHWTRLWIAQQPNLHGVTYVLFGHLWLFLMRRLFTTDPLNSALWNAWACQPLIWKLGKRKETPPFFNAWSWHNCLESMHSRASTWWSNIRVLHPGGLIAILH